MRAALPVIYLCLAVVGGKSAPAAGLGVAEWLAYLAAYVSPDGRVVDTWNDRVSHSEGQGYGMVLALAFDDRPGFERLWRWTQDHLMVRDDALLAWIWDPTADGGGAVTDPNNATDGDLLVAWALLEAGERWDRPEWVEAAETILADVASRLVVPTEYGPALLPAMQGFTREDAVVLNPSYWVFPALQAFARHQPDGPWEELIETGLKLLEKARFGEHELPPDWLQVAGKELALPADFDRVFGYNALRIPLYVVWSDVPDSAELLRPVRAFWAAFDGESLPPATVDLETGAFGPDPLSAGGQAILALARFGDSNPLAASAMMPPLRPSDDYYASTLLLLSKLALHKGRLG